MTLRKSFTLSVANLWHDKMRSLLTMLGMIIGVAAVIILMSLMNGMTSMVTEEFESMGMQTITVSITNRGGSRTVDEDDMYGLMDDYPEYIEALTPSVSVSGTLKNGETSLTESATGINEYYDDMNDLTIDQGRFLQYTDMEKKTKVCVIGTYIENELFGKGQGLGQTVKLNGTSLTVVGVLTEEDDSEENGDDDCIYIPYTTALDMSSTGTISSYTVEATSSDTVETAVEVLEQFLLNKLGDSDYYTVTSVKSLMDSATAIIDTMQYLLIAIAGISLLVAGIGIMNIMLVSVTERTREIGIRKSLGAKRADIQTQFVIEAGTVSAIGGVIGIILGAIVSIAVGLALDINGTPTVSAISISFGVSVAIGVIFGFLPARNAAALNPIDALRYD